MGDAFRAVLLSFLAAAALPLPAIADDTPVSIVLIGDSYLIGHGVAVGDKFKDRLLPLLNADGLMVEFIDTGFNQTSASTAARLGVFFKAPQYFPAATNPVVILEEGSNDCFTMRLDRTRASLSEILATFADKEIPVLVVATTPYDRCDQGAEPNYDADYIKMFADLADQYGDLYYRDFKEGVSDHPELMQGDGDHPNAQGEAVIVAKMLPVVQELVALAQRP
jgi:acyl-CoA thioesterase I